MELLREYAPNDRTALVCKEYSFLAFAQLEFRIHGQKVFSLNGKVREFTVWIVCISHSAKVVRCRQPRHSCDGRDALLVCDREVVEAADAIACDQTSRALIDGPTQRRHECL